MRNMLAFLGAAVLTVVVVGWYLGWYRVNSAPADQGKRNVNIEFNTTKISDDLHKGGAKLHGVLDKNRAPAESPQGSQEPSEKAQ